MRMRRIVLATLLLFGAANSQQSTAAPAAIDDDTRKFVLANFGSAFTPAPPPGKNTAVLFTADFDGDGQEDAVIIAQTKEPFAKAVELDYKVIDPYDEYFGWGNARDTARFAEKDDRARVLLIVHSWRAAVPKAKFVVINVPFDHLAVESVSLKKKQRTVISASEEDSMRSYLYWDGKKWRFAPGPME